MVNLGGACVVDWCMLRFKAIGCSRDSRLRDAFNEHEDKGSGYQFYEDLICYDTIRYDTDAANCRMFISQI